MDTKVAENEAKLIKYQVFLGIGLQKSLRRYIQDNYPPGTRVQTAIIRKALVEFLKKEGYYDVTTKEARVEPKD